MAELEQQNVVNQNQFKQPKRGFYKKPLFYVAIIVVCMAGFVLYRAGSFYGTVVVRNTHAQESQIQNSPTFDSQNPLPSQNPDLFTVLILGNGVAKNDNSVIEDTGDADTDTLELLIFNKSNGQAELVSIPRDLWVEMINTTGVNASDAYTYGKINEAYVRGSARGVAYVSQLVSRITGMYIDNTVVVNLNAFNEIVNTIGGIDISLDKPFVEPTQWTYPFSLPAGYDHINGEQAIYYVRSRFGSDDFDRSRRMQQVIFAIKNKLISLGFLGNPFKVSSLISSVQANVKTDFQIQDVNSMMSIANSLNGSKIQTYVISTDNLVQQSKSSTGLYILLPKGGNFDGFRSFFKDIFVNGSAQQNGASVQK